MNFSRPARTAKSRGSTTTYLEIRLDEIADVRLSSLGERQMLAIIPKPECAARLRELGWPEEDLVLVADPRPNREVERRLMVLHFRSLVDELGLIGPAPNSLSGLNGSLATSGTTITLEPGGDIPDLPQLAAVTYEFADIVDTYLWEQGSVMYLQILDETAAQTLLGGEVRYAFDRTLVMDLGMWAEAVPFYERLPRFGDREARDLRSPEDHVLQAALDQWSKRYATASTSELSLVEQLERLAALHNDGVLSQEEFNAAKTRLLP